MRPERVVLAPKLEPRDGWNIFDTEVEEVVFHGANVHFRLRLPNGRELVAQRPNDSLLGVAPGDRIQAGWPAENAVMLEE